MSVLFECEAFRLQRFYFLVDLSSEHKVIHQYVSDVFELLVGPIYFFIGEVHFALNDRVVYSDYWSGGLLGKLDACVWELVDQVVDIDLDLFFNEVGHYVRHVRQLFISLEDILVLLSEPFLISFTKLKQQLDY